MKYIESLEIKLQLETASKILITSHIDPDADNVGSILALYNMLEKLGKNSTVLLEDNFPFNFDFLPNIEKVKNGELSSSTLKDYDLIIALDTASWQRAFLDEISVDSTELNIVVIDHHFTNTKFGKINLVTDSSSTAESLYNFFNDCGWDIDEKVAMCLLTGIVGDTGCFKYISSPDTLLVAKELINKGADIRIVTNNLFSRVEMKNIKFWAYAIEKMKIEQHNGVSYVWSSVSHSELEKLGDNKIVDGASQFFASIEGTEFGGIFVEEEKNIIYGSFRSKGKIDVAKIAQNLFGGGHKAAAGFKFKLDELTFDQGIKKILDTINENIS